MKLKIKSKAQLIKEGWVENTKSIYFRLSIDGVKPSGPYNSRYRNERIGVLTDYQVESFLGKTLNVVELMPSNEIPYIKVEGSHMGMVLQLNYHILVLKSLLRHS